MVDTLSPQQRDTAINRLYEYFGQTGGTIHQLAQQTNLSVDDLLDALPRGTATIDSPYIRGISALETCDLTWRKMLAAKYATEKPYAWRAEYYAGVMFGAR